MADLSIQALRKDFDQVTALADVSIDVPSGTFVSLLGPSGCGKSTLLRCIAGLERVTSGRIAIAGEDVTDLAPEERRLAMMFQSYALFPHMSVLENVRFPLRMQRKEPVDKQRERAREALALVRMDGFVDRRPKHLSGGQQQRVALARAIVSRPRVLLLDEPLSNLDARLREEMQIELIELHQALKLTTVFVTHDQEEAMSLSDLVVLMSTGHVEQVGDPETIYDRPGSSFAADFLGAANLLPCSVAAQGTEVTLAAGHHVPVRGSVPRGHGVLVLRQEHLRLGDRRADDDAAVPVEVVARVFRGASVQYVVEYAGTRMRLSASKSAPRPTGIAELSWRSADARVLPREEEPRTTPAGATNTRAEPVAFDD